MDAALHRHAVTRDELDDSLRFCWSWPGIRRAQRAVRLSDGRAESPLESVSRLSLHWLGIPAADLQTIVLDQFLRFTARAELAVRVQRAFERGRKRDRSGVPRLWSL